MLYEAKRGEIMRLAAWIVALGILTACSGATAGGDPTARGLDPIASKLKVYSYERRGYIVTERVQKSEEEWKKLLTPLQFEVTRKKGTERAFTGEYVNNHQKGVYECVCCGNDLFSSDTKFESGTGWPSYWAPIAKENVTERNDRSLLEQRTEILCSRCGAHIGHVFDDGPEPTGLRYCMNSVAMKFVPAK